MLEARFVEESGEDVGVEDRLAAAEDLDPRHPLLRRPLDEFARLFRRVDRTAVPRAGAGEDERDEARRDDLVARAAVALVDAPVGAVAAARLADRGDAVRHPEFEDVLRARPLFLAAGVAVHVDEAGEHVHAGQVDLFGRVLRPPLGFDRHLREADTADLLDAVLLDDDVDRSDRRSAGAIDQRGSAEDQPIVWSGALVWPPIRRVAPGCSGSALPATIMKSTAPSAAVARALRRARSRANAMNAAA